MNIKRIFLVSFSVTMLTVSSNVIADSHAANAAEEMTKEAGDAAKEVMKVASSTMASAADALPNAKAGECYAKVIVPAEYKTESQKVTIKEASSKIEIIPAKYEWVEEKVLVKEASKKLVPVPAAYASASEKVLVTPAEKFWSTGTGKNAPRANLSKLSGAFANGLNVADAKVGNCYAEHIIPAQYKTESQQVLKSEASHKIEIIPAKYQLTEEKVLVKEASAKLIEVPAVYEKVTEKVLVKPATTEWKKGRGPVERLDNSTGEIMCLVEIPAVYKTVSKTVLKSPTKTKKVEIPAEYKVEKIRKLVSAPQEKKIEIPATYENVSKRVKVADEKVLWALVGSNIDGKATGARLCLKEKTAIYKTVKQKKVKTPASVKVVELPAEYKVVKKRKLVTAASEKKIEIPAKTEVVSKKVKVTEESLQWRPVLCETNMGEDTITKIQHALKKAGYDPGAIDGLIGKGTLEAVDKYQRANNLPRGGLTLRTLDKLGVKI